MWFTHPKIIKVNHNGKAKDKVKVIWEDLVKIYGNNPKKLLNTISENNLTNKIVTPWWEVKSNVLNSLWRIKIIFLQSNLQREGEAQKK